MRGRICFHVFSGCGAGAALPVGDGREQRTVNFYNWSNYMAPGVLEDFTRETGIKVVYDTFDANETLETRLMAGKSGYDVVVPTAYFLQRQITANIFQKLDKSRLPNLANAWPVVTQRLATYDPGNLYAANYMWGTTGIGYNVKMVQKILGPDAQIDSWDIVFKPENLAKFKECGVHMLDSADDIFPAALGYLGLDPNSTKQADLEKAADLVAKVRPFVRKFHSSEYLSALATGEICLVVGWSGDIMQARSRAAEAKGMPRATSRSAIRSRNRARRCSSTISRFPPMRRMSRRPTSSSTISTGPMSRRKIPISCPTPTAIWRARN